MEDFESVGVCEGGNDMTMEASELLSIFKGIEQVL